MLTSDGTQKHRNFFFSVDRNSEFLTACYHSSSLSGLAGRSRHNCCKKCSVSGSVRSSSTSLQTHRAPFVLINLRSVASHKTALRSTSSPCSSSLSPSLGVRRHSLSCQLERWCSACDSRHGRPRPRNPGWVGDSCPDQSRDISCSWSPHGG